MVKESVNPDCCGLGLGHPARGEYFLLEKRAGEGWVSMPACPARHFSAISAAEGMTPSCRETGGGASTPRPEPCGPVSERSQSAHWGLQFPRQGYLGVSSQSRLTWVCSRTGQPRQRQMVKTRRPNRPRRMCSSDSSAVRGKPGEVRGHE